MRRARGTRHAQLVTQIKSLRSDGGRSTAGRVMESLVEKTMHEGVAGEVTKGLESGRWRESDRGAAPDDESQRRMR